jgi:hypothetical protein
MSLQKNLVTASSSCPLNFHFEVREKWKKKVESVKFPMRRENVNKIQNI